MTRHDMIEGEPMQRTTAYRAGIAVAIGTARATAWLFRQAARPHTPPTGRSA